MGTTMRPAGLPVPPGPDFNTTPSLSPVGAGFGGPTSSQPTGLAFATCELRGRRQRTAVRAADEAMTRPGTRILMYNSSEMTPGDKRRPKYSVRVLVCARLG